MRYSVQNNGAGTVLIRVYAPESFAASFLSFIHQKSRENVPKIISASYEKNENYLIGLTARAVALFDGFVSAGSSIKSAVSETNYTLKTSGYANVSYDMVKQILQKSGKLKRKTSKISPA